MSKAAVGLLSGLAVIVLALIVVGIVNLPEAEGAVSGRACRPGQVAPDQGYAVTRAGGREFCASGR